MQGLNPNGKLQMVRVDADGKLVVTGVSGGGGGSGTSDTTEATQLLVKAAVQNLDADVGAPADAAATSDTGTFSLIALVKRALQNWTTLLARVPTLVSGRMPVDPTGAVQTGTGAVTGTTQRVTLATDGPGVSSLSSIDGKTPVLVSGRMPVDGSGVTQPVSASALPLPAGAATATRQDATNARLSRMGGLAMAETEEVGSTVYVMRRSSIDSAMPYVVVRYVTTGSAVAIRYAGVVNNPTMTTSALAWTNRATLVYGSLAEA